MNLEIRPMSEEDIRAVAALEKQCFSTPWSEQVLAMELRNQNACFFTAVQNGSLAGYIGMHTVLDEGYIANVAVDRASRRQGIADALLGWLAAFAEEKRLGFITLEVRESNTPAIALYRKNGFGIAGRRRNFYSAPAEDALLMTRFFGRKKEDK